MATVSTHVGSARNYPRKDMITVLKYINPYIIPEFCPLTTSVERFRIQGVRFSRAGQSQQAFDWGGGDSLPRHPRSSLSRKEGQMSIQKRATGAPETLNRGIPMVNYQCSVCGRIICYGPPIFQREACRLVCARCDTEAANIVDGRA